MRRVLLCLIVLSAAASASASGESPSRLAFFKMGGIPVNVSLWGVSPDRAEELRGPVERRLDELEAKLSRYRPESLVNRLRFGDLSCAEDPDLRRLLRHAHEVSLETEGAFDITVAPLVDLWKAARKAGRPPGPGEIRETLSRVGYRLLGEDGLDVARLTGAGGSIDPGGIAKGFMADEILKLLKRNGVRKALVEIGGDLSAYNELDDRLFRIGIRDPLQGDRLFGVIRFEGGSVVTSGNYERGFEIAGRRYGHIVDPRTGIPTADTPLSVTVMAPTGWKADAWATALYVMGPEKGLRAAKAHRIEALFVLRGGDGRPSATGTPGILGRFQARDPDTPILPSAPVDPEAASASGE